MSDIDRIEDIEAYLLGTMSPADRDAFEADMKENTGLAQQVAFQRSLISEVKRTAVQDQIRMAKRHIRQDNIRTIRLAVAASVAILIVGSLIYFLVSGSTDTDQNLLATAYQAPKAWIGNLDGEETAFQRSLIEPLFAYSEEDIAAAIAGFEALLPEYEGRDTLHFFLGVCYLENQNSQQAIKELRKVYEQESSVYADTSTWYLALAWLQVGQRDSVLIWLDKVPAGVPSYDTDAVKKLRARIKELNHEDSSIKPSKPVSNKRTAPFHPTFSCTKANPFSPSRSRKKAPFKPARI